MLVTRSHFRSLPSLLKFKNVGPVFARPFLIFFGFLAIAVKCVILKVPPRLTEEPHGLKAITPAECQVGGLRDERVTYCMYNVDWSRRLVK